MYALVLCVIISGRAALFICKCKLLQHERKRDWKIRKKEESNGIKIVKIVERERERERERFYGRTPIWHHRESNQVRIHEI